ncbi:MAG TPA: DUF4442 domain-containing protein [Flavisolibacter sp.]
MRREHSEAGTAAASFTKLVKSQIRFRLFLLRYLPAALFSGVRVGTVTSEACTVSIRYRWFTRNPFGSTYFASLSMAAEMSTGILVMAGTYGRSPRIAMLVTAIEGTFLKKATGITRFTCREGMLIQQAIEAASRDNEPHVVRVFTSGVNENDETVAEFYITWSVKARKTVGHGRMN